LTGYQWLEPGTTNVISKKKFGPLENHVFTIQGKNGIAEYRDSLASHMLSGMKGGFIVDNIGESIPGKSPRN
jgi:manganese oxidase